MTHRIMCIDMDAFYVSCEQAFKPYLKKRPLAVGSVHERGVVCTCSYEARKYGISSGMSSVAAKNIYPDIIFLPVDFNKYGIISSNIFKLISNIIPSITISSIDEAYADITNIDMEPLLLIKKIKYLIKKYFDITCTIGVGPNKLIAKMATTVNKPNGYYIVDESSIISFIDSFPLSKVWGIGTRTKNRLAEYGIFTVQELRLTGKDKLEEYIGSHGQKIYNAVLGLYEEDTNTKLENKSVSKATTFPYDISSKQEIYNYIKLLSFKVYKQLVDKNYVAKIITINWKTFRFESKSFRKTLKTPVFSSDDIFKYAKELFDEHSIATVPLRLIGVGVMGLLEVDENYYNALH